MKFPNIDKQITTLAMNINFNSYVENVKNRTLQILRTFSTFQKDITNIAIRTKNCWQRVMCQGKEKSIDKLSYVKERKKLLTKCHASKKGKTADKVSCLKL